MLLQAHWSIELRNLTLEKYEQFKGRKTEDLEFYEVIALYVRLVEMTISFKSSAIEVGMKENTKDKLKKLKPVSVKGKSEPIPIYSVLDQAS